jgi:flagellin-like hook-associated protein FlgL
MSGISLTASVRTTLASLKDTSRNLETTTNRLSTGKKVASAIDNPTNYFAAENYNARADALESRLDSMGEATQMINAADNGITSIKSYLSQMKGVVNNALSNTDSTQRQEYGKQFNELIRQVRDVTKDSSYGGINLIYNNASTTVQFGENIGDSTLTLQGFNISAASGALNVNGELGSSGVLGASFASHASVAANTKTSVASAASVASGNARYALSVDLSGAGIVGIKSAGTDNTGASGWEIDWGSTNYQTDLTSVISTIEDFEGTLQVQSSKLANNLAIITQREDYTQESIDILNNGADDLTLADMNEEGANLLSLQTSQSLAVQSLSLASSSAANVLSIIK